MSRSNQQMGSYFKNLMKPSEPIPPPPCSIDLESCAYKNKMRLFFNSSYISASSRHQAIYQLVLDIIFKRYKQRKAAKYINVQKADRIIRITLSIPLKSLTDAQSLASLMHNVNQSDYKKCK